MEAKPREVFEALAADAPLRGRDGGLPAADTLAVRMLAECLVRLGASARPTACGPSAHGQHCHDRNVRRVLDAAAIRAG